MERIPVRKDYEYFRTLPPENYPEELKLWFYEKTGQELDLEHPKTFNEKVQWLKLYDSTPEKTRLADKYLVREWIREQIGEAYLIPLLGVWDSFDEIDFDALPRQFVLKANHGSGWNVVVRDKYLLDRDEAKRQMDFWMQKNFALSAGFELHYADIPPKIIAEQYMADLDGEMADFRFFCFDGVPRSVWVDTGSGTAGHRRSVFDMDWTLQDMRVNYPLIEPTPEKPANFDEMRRLAAKLSAGFALVRVDFYSIHGKTYFGEMTFTSQSGIGRWEPEEQNRRYGDWITLPAAPLPLPTKSFAERGAVPLPDGFRRRETDYRLRVKQELWEKGKLEKQLRQTGVQSAELERKLADTRRQQADSEKALAETEKALAGTETMLAETRKQQAETERTLAEAHKQQAETEKTLAETLRQKAETEQTLADAVRQREELQKELKQSQTEAARLSEQRKQAYAEKAEARERMKQAYAEKAEMHERMLQAYAEKSEMRDWMKQAYAEKAEARERMLLAFDDKTAALDRMRQAYAEKAEMHERMLRAYAEKAEVRERMLKAYAEKDAVRQEMKSAYAQRDQYRDELRAARRSADCQAAELEALRTALANERRQREKLKSSHAYRIGRFFTWPVRKLKALLGR